MPQRLSALSRTAAPLAAAALLAGWPGAAGAAGGAYKDSAHGNRQTGVLRVPGLPRGECAHCHGTPRDAAGRKGEGTGHTRLYALNDNTLCGGCHARQAGSWLGMPRYDQSAHGSSPSAVWPGPEPRGRPPADAGKCINCHDPHGVRDASGVIPSLARVRGAVLCLGCHAGSPATDVASAFAKTFRHPLLAQGSTPQVAVPASQARQDPASPFVKRSNLPRLGAGGALAGAALAGTCAGCHNPHANAGERSRPAFGTSSGALAGVRRVRVTNGAPGATPVLQPVEATDTTIVQEFEVCFTCHAGAAATAARITDVAVAFNPVNASFHPVEAVGRNRNLDRRSFTQGWSQDRQVTCSDCHGSDGEETRGPHGSSQAHLLRRRHPTREPALQLQETDLCFACHAWRTYADPLAGLEQRFSRFSSHATHVSRGASCWSCHEAHGSSALPALAAKRIPGFLTYVQDATGGTCTVSCHASTPPSATYRVTYPR